jgi:diguanylate cyclase (GGDEF)-like protein
MMDIDHFKNVNDTYGHQNGDAVLSRLGEIILTESNLDVHCYRYGGEEFAILLDKRSVSYAENIAERIRSAMELERWDFDKGLVITISAGVAYGSREADVLHQADENLYKSKESGRNRITVSSV